MANRNVDKERALSQEALRSYLCYDAETGEFIRLTSFHQSPIGSVAGTVLATGYRVIRACGSRFLAHRLAWFYVYGEWPIELDHINRDKDDNRLINLREVSRSGNMVNSGGWSNSTLGIKNISRKRKSFHVQVFRDGETIYRETFACLGQAVKARDAATGGNIV
jgi:hypothetical protein